MSQWKCTRCRRKDDNETLYQEGGRHVNEQAILIQDVDEGQIVSLANLVVIMVMGRGDFDSTWTENRAEGRERQREEKKDRRVVMRIIIHSEHTADQQADCLFPSPSLPVPKLMSTKSSKTIGILRSQKGCSTIFPFRCWYLESAGWTATAVSPSIVSIRVVATITSSSKGQKEKCQEQCYWSDVRCLKNIVLYELYELVYLIRPPCRRKTPKRQTPLSLCNQAQATESCRWALSYPPVDQPEDLVKRAEHGQC